MDQIVILIKGNSDIEDQRKTAVRSVGSYQNTLVNLMWIIRMVTTLIMIQRIFKPYVQIVTG